jgi:hypothetical protein
MKRILLVVIVILSWSTSSNAQLFKIPRWDYYWDLKAHEKGQMHFFYGYGQPRLDKKLFDYHRNEEAFRVVGVGPFCFKFEYGLSRKLSVALTANYSRYKSDWLRRKPDPLFLDTLAFRYGTTYNDLVLNLRFNYHLFVSRDLDVYLGGGAGYNYTSHSDFTNYGPEDTTFNARFKEPYMISGEMSLGVRYYFLTRNAIFLEVGYGKSIVQAGFVFKFRHRKRE